MSVVTVCALAATTLALGLLLAAMPYFTCSSECFAVTVPSSAHDDMRLISLKRGYFKTMAAITTACTLLSLYTGVLIVQGLGGDQDAKAASLGIALEIASMLLPVFASFLLMLRNRRKVIAVKREEGWAASGSVRSAVVNEPDLPGPVPLFWNLIYIVIMLATAAVGLVLYPDIPDLIPMHSDLAGNVDRWAEKSVVTVLVIPLLIEAFLGLVCFACHAFIVCSKRPNDPDHPAASALAYGMFARAQSICILLIGAVLSGAVGFSFILSAARLLSMGQIGTICIVLTLLVVVGVVALCVVYGQNGSRLLARMKASPLMPQDDDEHWKLGILYFNRDDPSLFLPKRFGVGWTINFARPAAWLLTLCVFAADAAVLAMLLILA